MSDYCGPDGGWCMIPIAGNMSDYCGPDGGRCVIPIAGNMSDYCGPDGERCVIPLAGNMYDYCGPNGERCGIPIAGNMSDYCGPDGGRCVIPIAGIMSDYCGPDGGRCVKISIVPLSSSNMLLMFKSPAVTALVAFVAWTVTSFLCHECGKTFLNLSKVFFMPSSFTNPVDPMFYFISSLVLTVTQAASTLAIKLTEPVTMALAHHVVFKTPVSMETIVSVPLIILGALLFSLSTIINVTETTGIFLAFLSNIILTARNVAIKKLQGDNTFPVELRSTSRIVGLVLVEAAILLIVFFLGNDVILPANSYFLLGAMFLSGIGHVTYSYISTIVVLKVMNIVSHSVANIFKRVLVVLLLYLCGQRSATAWNFMGLTISVIGLYIYLRGKFNKASVQHFFHNEHTPLWSSKSLHRGVALCLCLMSVLSVMNVARRNELRDHSVYSSLIQTFDYRHLMKDNGHIQEKDPKLAEFLTWRLVDHPEETDMRSKTLTTNVEVIEEALRVLINLLTDLIGPIKHVMLMEIAVYSNKGDPAISAGEVMLLRKMNKTIVYYCETTTCNSQENIKQEEEISKNYTKDNLVIIMQGGGNLVGYSGMDVVRRKIMDRYPEHRKILLSQSIWLKNNNSSLLAAQKIYNNRTNLTIFLRDRQSLEIAKRYFHGMRLILAPDLAFGLGPIPRQMPPVYDIIWLKRKDGESGRYTLPSFPKNISVHVSDWTTRWSSNVGSRHMETSFLIGFSGLNFLQRGRVVVTDRLHGHILSTLLNIPHVLIDNPPYLKLSSFDKSWTASLENTVLINNGTLGLEEALKLLKKYDSILPQVGPVDMNRFQLITKHVNISTKTDKNP
ncbi:pyruvyl transferase Pvg1 [Bulinus truncatus]|nr:pyruvyl transferase Pvg1 [Bulinus truncatus]